MEVAKSDVVSDFVWQILAEKIFSSGRFFKNGEQKKLQIVIIWLWKCWEKNYFAFNPFFKNLDNLVHFFRHFPFDQKPTATRDKCLTLYREFVIFEKINQK